MASSASTSASFVTNATGISRSSMTAVPIARALVRVAPVVADVRVQVAVAGVEDVGDFQSALLADVGGGAYEFAQARAGHDGVGHVQVWRDPPHRSVRALPSGPQARAFVGGSSAADVVRSVTREDGRDVAQVRRDLDFRAFAFDEENRARILR